MVSAAHTLDPSKVLLARVDATAEEDLAEEYGIEGFPTLKWFVDGDARDYKGGRTSAAIVRWIGKRLGAASDTLPSAAAATEWLRTVDRSSLTVLALLDTTDEGSIEAYHAVARIKDSAAFAHTPDVEAFTAAAQAGGVPLEALGTKLAPPLVVLLKPFDERYVVLSVTDLARYGDSLKLAVTDLLMANQLPLVVPFSAEYQVCE